MVILWPETEAEILLCLLRDFGQPPHLSYFYFKWKTMHAPHNPQGSCEDQKWERIVNCEEPWGLSNLNDDDDGNPDGDDAGKDSGSG